MPACYYPFFISRYMYNETLGKGFRRVTSHLNLPSCYEIEKTVKELTVLLNGLYTDSVQSGIPAFSR